MAEPVVLIEEHDAAAGGFKVGVATLNAPAALNALNLSMIRALHEQLRQWADDPHVACVLLQGAGDKAFCAGGDVRSLHAAIAAHGGKPAPNPQAQAFFGEEYRLDHHIHTHAKPIVVWGGGIVMGGGLGLMAGASHRVVTETSRIAMPEVAIGLFPDVGGSWFLRRMPGRTGLFLGLTGAPLAAADALYTGLADHLLAEAQRPTLLPALLALPWQRDALHNRRLLSRLLGSLAQPRPASVVQAHQAVIDEMTAGDALPAVVERITGYAGDSAWLRRAAAALAAGSPTSMALVWEAWRRSEGRTLAEMLRMELVLALQCCAHPDFAEGVRARLIDKDNAPRWTPATLDEVSLAWVAQHFETPAGWPGHPLADL